MYNLYYMKKISPEEVSNYSFTKRGYKLNNASQSKVQKIKDTINGLNVGEALIITKEEWPLKTPPRQFLSNEMRDVKKQTGTLQDGSGWIIIRQ